MSDTQDHAPKVVDVVAETIINQPQFCSCEFQEGLGTNTVPLEQTFQKIDDTHYVVLEKESFKFDKPHSNIEIVSYGCIDHIYLDGFPHAQYTLQINGHNCATSGFDTERNCYEFDLVTKPSRMLQSMIFCSHSTMNGSDDAMPDFLNCLHVDRLEVIYPKGTPLSYKHKITLHGYFNGKLGYETIEVYPRNTFNLNLNNPTDFIQLRFSQFSPSYFIRLLINGIPHLETHVERDEQCRIKFHNPDMILMGIQNNVLPDTINRETLNLSRVDHLQLVVIGTPGLKVDQFYYMAYRYPSRTQMWCR